MASQTQNDTSNKQGVFDKLITLNGSEPRQVARTVVLFTLLGLATARLTQRIYRDGLQQTLQSLLNAGARKRNEYQQDIHEFYQEFKAEPDENDRSLAVDATSLPSNVEIVASKALRVLFSVIRDKKSKNTEYVFFADRLCRILAEEGVARLCTEEVVIETHCGQWKGPRPIGNGSVANACAVSIVRSGDILLEAVRSILPGLAVGKILLQRDEKSKDKKAVHYYTKLPHTISSMQVILVDPMVATGGSACGALQILVASGCKQENILFLSTISCPEGLWKIHSEYPNIRILTGAVDSHLNEQKFIVPGLGDFGDRYYRTDDG